MNGPITSVAMLRKEIAKSEPGLEVFINLNYGVRSSKFIQWVEDIQKFYVLNYIDSTEQYLTEKELFTRSNIGEAIAKRALYKS